MHICNLGALKILPFISLFFPCQYEDGLPTTSTVTTGIYIYFPSGGSFEQGRQPQEYVLSVRVLTVCDDCQECVFVCTRCNLAFSLQNVVFCSSPCTQHICAYLLPSLPPSFSPSISTPFLHSTLWSDGTKVGNYFLNSRYVSGVEDAALLL